MHTILCVDEHRATLLTLSLIFRGAGYRCITAFNFAEAERAFAADHIDLVVLDQGWGISGTELAAHLRKIRTVAILMLSGSIELDVVPGSVDLLLPKPRPPEELLKAVAVLLELASAEITHSPGSS